MNWFRKTYRVAADHFGKILSTVGAALIGLDVAGYADQVKIFAAQYLGDKAAQKVGFILFLLLIARTTYTGLKSKKPEMLPPPSMR